MTASDREGFPDGCFFCDGEAGRLHHISYVPEVVVLMCADCHGRVHSEGYDGELLHPDLVPEMSRGEWKQKVWDGKWIPRPTAEQITWDDDEIGTVDR